uniref:TPT domain-containing protein n=1 Tax=Heterorhabditis bacteriophora TaxID=37862 RepID=A0A1I7WMJ6_HETBA
MDYSAPQDMCYHSLIWASMFFTFSLASSILNQLIESSLFFEFPLILILFQGGLTLTVLETLKYFKLLRFSSFTLSISTRLILPAAAISVVNYITVVLVDNPNYLYIDKVKCFGATTTVCFFLLVTRRTISLWYTTMAFISSVTIYYGLSFDDSPSDSSFWIGGILIFLQISSHLMISQTLRWVQSPEFLYIQSLFTVIILFGVELFKHDVKMMSTYLFIWRFPYFFPVFGSLLFCNIIAHYAFLKTLQYTDIFTVAMISNMRAACQFIIFYYIYRYVSMQKTWEKYSTISVCLSVLSTIISTIFCIGYIRRQAFM